MDLTTPTFFISFETVVMLNRVGSDVNKGLLPPVLPLLDEAELGGGVVGHAVPQEIPLKAMICLCNP